MRGIKTRRERLSCHQSGNAGDRACYGGTFQRFCYKPTDLDRCPENTECTYHKETVEAGEYSPSRQNFASLPIFLSFLPFLTDTSSINPAFPQPIPASFLCTTTLRTR